MAAPYSIEIFVPEGEPEGLRILSLKNWTGVCLVFPRSSWITTRKRAEFGSTGVYLLYGYGENNPDIPLVYIGQTDELRTRLDQHEKTKEFWDRCIVFVSTNNFLNRADVTWLEATLYKMAKEMGQCELNNSQVPGFPSMSEPDEANMQFFIDQMMQVYPLAGVQIFEKQVTLPSPSTSDVTAEVQSAPSSGKDTIIVPANQEGFDEVFIGENCWYAIRIGGGMLDKLKYIAAYQTQPISAITHLAEVDHLELYGDAGKYKVVFKEPAKEIKHIPYGDAPSGAMQGPRYTKYDLVTNADTLTDII
jgi:hypothetical protein